MAWAGYLARGEFVPRMGANFERLGASTFHSEVAQVGEWKGCLVGQQNGSGLVGWWDEWSKDLVRISKFSWGNVFFLNWEFVRGKRKTSGLWTFRKMASRARNLGLDFWDMRLFPMYTVWPSIGAYVLKTTIQQTDSFSRVVPCEQWSKPWLFAVLYIRDSGLYHPVI